MQYNLMYQTKRAFVAAKEVTAFDTSFTDTKDFGERDGLAQTARVLNECSLFKMNQLSQREDSKLENPYRPEKETNKSVAMTPSKQQQPYATRSVAH